MSETTTANASAPAIQPNQPTPSAPAAAPKSSTPVPQQLVRNSVLVRKPYMLLKGRHSEPNPDYKPEVEGSQSHHIATAGSVVFLTDAQYESFKGTGKFSPHQEAPEKLRAN